MRALLAALLVTLATALGAVAQTETAVAGGILVIDQERLFGESAFGQGALARTEAATDALVAENRRIESELIAEERDLTDQRAELAAEEFRTLADDFDARVQSIRAEQNRKSELIGRDLEEERRRFFQEIVPVLADILRERGAVAIVDKRTVLISTNRIDVTDLAIARIDERLGNGGAE